MSDKGRVRSGIKGLDKDWGGVPRGRTVLVTGDAGTGKTILGLQFASASGTDGLRTCYITTEESIEDLRSQGDSLGIGLTEFETAGLLTFVDLASERISNLSSMMELQIEISKGNFDPMVEAIPKGTEVVVIDSLGNHTARLSPGEFKDRFTVLVHKMNRLSLTALVIIDSATSGSYNDLALYSAYGAIRLSKRENPYTDQRERVMDIVKMRNTKVPLQLLEYSIGPGGISILTGNPSEKGPN